MGSVVLRYRYKGASVSKPLNFGQFRAIMKNREGSARIVCALPSLFSVWVKLSYGPCQLGGVLPERVRALRPECLPRFLTKRPAYLYHIQLEPHALEGACVRDKQVVRDAEEQRRRFEPAFHARYGREARHAAADDEGVVQFSGALERLTEERQRSVVVAQAERFARAADGGL